MFKRLLNRKIDKGTKATFVIGDNKPKMSIEQQIHNDVYSAHDLLLKSMDEKLENSTVDNKYSKEDIERITTLERLGFLHTIESVEYENYRRYLYDLEVLKNKRERLKYYSYTYPFNKFIDEGAVKAICNKYRLFLTNIQDYISDIPLKNQKEIIDFKIYTKDLLDNIEINERRYRRPDLLSSLYKESYDNGRGPIRYHKKEVDNKLIPGFYLQIIAPLEKLNKNGMDIDGYKLVNIKDPIVLQPVKDGYLIVTSWGLEASDPEVVNPKFN